MTRPRIGQRASGMYLADNGGTVLDPGGIVTAVDDRHVTVDFGTTTRTYLHHDRHVTDYFEVLTAAGLDRWRQNYERDADDYLRSARHRSEWAARAEAAGDQAEATRWRDREAASRANAEAATARAADFAAERDQALATEAA